MALEWGVSTGLRDKMAGGMLFIHGSIDDAGLDTESFRVLCHLARRAGQDAAAFPSLKSMARTCCLNVKTVARRIRRLVDAGLVVRVRRPGLSTRYELCLGCSSLSNKQQSASSDLEGSKEKCYQHTGSAEVSSSREVQRNVEPMAEVRERGGGNADVSGEAKRENDVLGFEEAVTMFEKEFPHIAVRASLAKMVGKPYRWVLTVANCREWLRREKQARFVPKAAPAKINAVPQRMSDEEWNRQSEETRPAGE